MKKFIVSMAVMAFAFVATLAQNTVVNNPDNRAYFGIRVGGEITCPGKVSERNVGVGVFKNGGGIEFGGLFNVPIVANFYFEPGMKFYYNIYSLNKEFLGVLQEYINCKSVVYKKFGMRVPVMFGYHFDFAKDFKVSIFTGPELEIGFSAKEHINGINVEITSENLYTENGAFNRMDLLWGVGAGFSYQHFYFGVSGGIGMLNMARNSYSKFHENRVTFSGGYNF